MVACLNTEYVQTVLYLKVGAYIMTLSALASVTASLRSIHSKNATRHLSNNVMRLLKIGLQVINGDVSTAVFI